MMEQKQCKVFEYDVLLTLSYVINKDNQWIPKICKSDEFIILYISSIIQHANLINSYNQIQPNGIKQNHKKQTIGSKSILMAINYILEEYKNYKLYHEIIQNHSIIFQIFQTFLKCHQPINKDIAAKCLSFYPHDSFLTSNDMQISK